MRSTRPVTMRDVAREAGASVAAVSRVLNRKTAVSKSMRARVTAACEKLDYRLNPAIQDLVRERRNGRTRNIAFVTVGTCFGDPAYSGALEGVTKGVNEFGYNLALAHLSGQEASVYDFPPLLRDGRVDGLLITGNLTAETTEMVARLRMPRVVIGAYGEQVLRGSDNVRVDVGSLMHGFVEGLRALGKTRIACFFEDPSNYYQQTALFEFRRAMADCDLPVDEELCYCGPGRGDGALNVLRPVLLRSGVPFDAIVCDSFACAQEISCLLVGIHGLHSPPDACIATILPDAQQRLYTPALVCRNIEDRIAYCALAHLVEDFDAGARGSRFRLEVACDKPTFTGPDYEVAASVACPNTHSGNQE